ncbi:hypothetical protein [Bacillus methanolicus]|uniref:Putative secreted protein n=1 Tax=Bacillus methanolicus (strain MGA3 / ATCC 53907) TaxID=796606 RepID=I3DU15_BACMM|nr:hypothetical protein [Bacillus methanolicus]AIE59834.1 putative secreted protein [Bacillus methanolicus MGA3]EIJ77736.1 hypothetical protein MGA3_16503 [Bacillus methanolicus MGA3]
MGVATLCTVTVTGTVGLVVVNAQVSVPQDPTGLIDATIDLPAPLPDLVLTGLPCPTLEPIVITIPGVLSLTITVSETPAP